MASPRSVQSFKADPDRDDRIIILRGDGKNYTIDTSGRMEPYAYPHALTAFAAKGLQSVEISTYAGGCFHYRPQTVRYRRQGDLLREEYSDPDSIGHGLPTLPASAIEEAIVRFGDRYSTFPSPSDFGLEDTTVDLRKVYDRRGFWSSSHVGFRVTIINSSGDTLYAVGSTPEGGEIDGTLRYPWLLPMSVHCQEVDFVSYQPTLWQALRPLMPEKMFLREQLDNATLKPPIELKSGDLLFSRQSHSDKEKAICESTGSYSHVAIVEVDSNGNAWILEAVPNKGVRRIAFSDHGHSFRHYFDIYRLTIAFDTAAVIARAKNLIGKDYDEAYLPDNDAYYCSELVQVAFDTLFHSQPMNWRDTKGKLPKYWKKHFKKMKMKVPEGVPGTNPTDLSRSQLLRKL